LFVPDAFWKEEVRGVRVEAVIAEAVRIGVAASMIKNDLGRASESRECILADTQRQSKSALIPRDRCRHCSYRVGAQLAFTTSGV
jgi:Na+/alanine symporter